MALGAVVVEEFLATELVLRLPTAVLSASIQIVAFICLTAGLILDSVCRNRREVRRLAYLALSPVSAAAGDASSADDEGRPPSFPRTEPDERGDFFDRQPGGASPRLADPSNVDAP